MQSYQVVKFGIFNDFSHQFENGLITYSQYLNCKQLFVSTTKELLIIEQKNVKYRFPIKLSTFSIDTEFNILIGTTIDKGEIILYNLRDFYQSSNTKSSEINRLIEPFSTNQTGIVHMIYSSKSKAIILVGNEIKIYSLHYNGEESKITRRSSITSNYSPIQLVPPAFDKENEILLIPTETGIFGYSVNGIKLGQISKQSFSNKTILATHSQQPTKTTDSTAKLSTSNLDKLLPNNSREILMYDANDGMSLMGGKGETLDRYDTIRSSVLAIFFIDSENAICLNSCRILFFLNIKTKKTFYYLNLEKNPTRLFIRFVKNEPYLCACFGAYFRVLRLVVPWRVWNTKLKQTLLIGRYNKFCSAARVLVDSENSFIKLFSPRDGFKLFTAKTADETHPVSYFYDRGIIENYTFNSENSSFEINVIEIRNEQNNSIKDSLFVSLQNGQILEFDPNEGMCEDVLQMNDKVTNIAICRITKNDNEFHWCYALATEKSGIYLHDYFTLKELDHFTISDDNLLKLFFDFGSNCIVLVYSQKTMLFDVESKKIIDNVSVKGSRVVSLFGNFLMYGYGSGHVRRVGIENKKFVLFNIENQRITNREKSDTAMWRPHSCPITGFSFGQKIWISSGLDGNVVIWDYNFNIIFKIYLPLPLRSCLILNGKYDILVATATEIMKIKSRHLCKFLKKEEKIDIENNEIDNFDKFQDSLLYNPTEVSRDESDEIDVDDEDEDEYEIEKLKQSLNPNEEETDQLTNDVSSPNLGTTTPTNKTNAKSKSPTFSSTIPSSSSKPSSKSNNSNETNSSNPQNKQSDPKKSVKILPEKGQTASKNPSNENKKDEKVAAADDKSKANSVDKTKAPSNNSVKPAKDKQCSSDKPKNNEKESSSDKSKENDKAKSASKDKTDANDKSGKESNNNKNNSKDKNKKSTDKSDSKADGKDSSKEKIANDKTASKPAADKNKESSGSKSSKAGEKQKADDKKADSNENKKDSQTKSNEKLNNEADDKENEKKANKNKSNTKSQKEPSSDATKAENKKETGKALNESKKADENENKADNKDSSKSKKTSKSKDDADSSSKDNSDKSDSKDLKSNTDNTENKNDSSKSKSKSGKTSKSNSKVDDDTKSKADSISKSDSKSESDELNKSDEKSKSDKDVNSKEKSQSNKSVKDKASDENSENIKNDQKSQSKENNEKIQNNESKEKAQNNEKIVNDDKNKMNERNQNDEKIENNKSNEGENNKETSEDVESLESENKKEIDNENNKNDDLENNENINTQQNQKDTEEESSIDAKESVEADNTTENNDIHDENTENDNLLENKENNESVENQEDSKIAESEIKESAENNNISEKLDGKEEKDDINEIGKDNESLDIKENNENNEILENDKTNEIKDDLHSEEKIEDNPDNENNETVNKDKENEEHNPDNENNEIVNEENNSENDEKEGEQIANADEEARNLDDDNGNNNEENEESNINAEEDNEDTNATGNEVDEQSDNENENIDNNENKNGNDEEEEMQPINDANQEEEEINEEPYTGEFVRVPPPNVIIDKDELFYLYRGGRREFKPLVDEVEREARINNNWRLNLSYVQNLSNSITCYEEYRKQKQNQKGLTLLPKEPNVPKSARSRRTNSSRTQRECFITNPKRTLSARSNVNVKSSNNQSPLPKINNKLFYPASYVHNYNNNVDTNDAIATPRLFGRFSNVDNMIEAIDSSKNNKPAPLSTSQKQQLPPLLFSQSVDSDTLNRSNRNGSHAVTFPVSKREGKSPRHSMTNNSLKEIENA